MRFNIIIGSLACSIGIFFLLRTIETPHQNVVLQPSSSAMTEEGEIDSSNAEDAAFDVATFFDSIEFMRNPAGVYKKFKLLVSTVQEKTFSWLHDRNNWVHQTVWKNGGTFSPYIQKLFVKPGDIFFIFGDLHGDSPALNSALEKLTEDGTLNEQWELEENHHLVFLGDYVDRGNYGIEVWYTLLKLREANPDPASVIILRGNHEELELNFGYGYLAELQKKFALSDYQNNNKDAINKKIYLELTEHLYNMLPIALYLTYDNESILCAHGGLDLGLNPLPLLSETDPHKIFMAITSLNRAFEITKLSQELRTELASLEDAFIKRYEIQKFFDITPYSSFDLDVLWNDFNKADPTEIGSRGSNIAIGPTLAKAIFERDHVCCMLRGHQHDLVINNTPFSLKGLFTFPRAPIHTIMSFSSIQGLDVCKDYSFIKIEIGKPLDESKAWHMRDGQEYPFALKGNPFIEKIKERSPSPIDESMLSEQTQTEETVETESLRPQFHLLPQEETEEENTVKKPRSEE